MWVYLGLTSFIILFLGCTPQSSPNINAKESNISHSRGDKTADKEKSLKKDKEKEEEKEKESLDDVKKNFYQGNQYFGGLSSPRSSPGTSEQVSGLTIGTEATIVGATNEDALIKLDQLISDAINIKAFDDPNTDYSQDQTNFHVFTRGVENLNIVNEILCFLGQTKFSTDITLNNGLYAALVDETQCVSNLGRPENSTQERGLSTSSQDNSFTLAIVRSERESNDDPQVVQLWIQDKEAGSQSALIKAEAIIEEGRSPTLPFGLFTMNWVMEEPDTEEIIGRGTIEITDPQLLNPSEIGFSFIMQQEENFANISGFDPEALGTLTMSASAAMQRDNSSGLALSSMQFEPDEGQSLPEEENPNNVVAIAYDEGHLLTQEATSYSGLPYVQDPNNSASGLCLSRTQFEGSIYRYRLYHADTGNRVRLNSGFPFTFECNSKEVFGHIGYWGSWIDDPNCQLEDGDTITRENFSRNSGEQFNVQIAAGKLIRHEVSQIGLENIKGMDLFYWDEFLNTAQAFENEPKAICDANNANLSFDNWVVRYITSDDPRVTQDGFYKVGGIIFGQDGTEIQLLSDLGYDLCDITPRQFDGEHINMWSDQLGGGVSYTKGHNFAIYNEESFVQPNDPLFSDNDTIALHGLADCLKANITQQDLATPKGPFFDPSNQRNNGMNSVHPLVDFPTCAYQISKTDMTLKDDVGNKIALANGAVSSGFFEWGIRSGPLVTADVLDNLQNWWEIFDNVGTTYYSWETGSNDWNQNTIVKKSSNQELVEFDSPIQFSYTHTTAKDRYGDNTADGVTVLLNYGGNGDLWGIPFEDISMERSQPLFNIADSTLLGPNGNDYVIKAIEGEQRPVEDAGQCTQLEVKDPPTPLPDVVSGAPSHISEPVPNPDNIDIRVIAGELVEF